VLLGGAKAVSTTTLRLPPDLRERLTKLAEKAGRTPHSLMLDAITQKVEEEELRAVFVEEADRRFAEMMASGISIPWHDMRDYLKARAVNKRTRAPKARKWRK
jgi:predicted transcriptional regulator